jgi:tetratricopeptide (TPR) repeat protein
MSRYGTSDIAHTASTDHRILRRTGDVVAIDAARLGFDLPIMPFYADQRESNDKDLQRDLALALVQHPGKDKAEAARVLRRAVDLLEAALRDDSGDVEALEAMAEALAALDDQPRALAALETALEKAPRRETALVAAATLSQKMKNLNQAGAYWRRAIDLNPWMPSYRRNFALLLLQKQALDDLRPQCEAWLRLDPASVDARRLWVACLLKDGKFEEARTEFAKIELLNPPNVAELKAWFAARSRSR